MNFVQHFAGTPVIVDKYAYSEKRTWRAVAVVVDKNRPNKVKPIFKRQLFIKRTPRAYLVKGVGLVVHPDIYQAMKEKMVKSMTKSINDMALGVGLSNTLQETTLTMDDFAKAFKLAK
jgi:hypothetical protein